MARNGGRCELRSGIGRLSLLNVVLFVAASCLLVSCSSSSPSEPQTPTTIVVTSGEHHLGDNSGSEGQTYESDFTVAGSFGEARVSVKFLYPNNAGQSGPEINSPPDILINGERVGLAAGDFPDDGCVSQYFEYDCDITITRDATSAVVEGDNTIQVVAQGEAHPGDDDFVFTNLKVLLYED